MDPIKVAGVTKWPALTNQKEVQSFLGFTNFYHQFIEDFSHHACPLFDLNKADTKWNWGPEEQSTFDVLKGKVISAPILVLVKCKKTDLREIPMIGRIRIRISDD